MTFGTELVERLKRGEKKAIHEWYRDFAPRLKKFFSSKVRHSQDIDELTHDVFLSCLSSLPLYRGEANFYGWMLSIARHELADYYRKLYAKRVISALPMGDQLLEAASHQTSESTQSVQSVLGKLPEAVAELLALKYIDKLSVEGIAEKLALSPHVVQGRLYRARNAFRQAFEQLENSYEEE
jgi:RNA polymerase sigma-70 factor, ECF subfamily